MLMMYEDGLRYILRKKSQDYLFRDLPLSCNLFPYKFQMITISATLLITEAMKTFLLEVIVLQILH